MQPLVFGSRGRREHSNNIIAKLKSVKIRRLIEDKKSVVIINMVTSLFNVEQDLHKLYCNILVKLAANVSR